MHRVLYSATSVVGQCTFAASDNSSQAKTINPQCQLGLANACVTPNTPAYPDNPQLLQCLSWQVHCAQELDSVLKSLSSAPGGAGPMALMLWLDLVI
jgi:hypothetical protein